MPKKKKHKQPVGRQSSLTPELQELVCQAIRSGNTARTSVAFAGIPEKTFYYWLERGREGGKDNDRYVQFMQAVEKARADAVVRNVDIIQQKARETWQAAAWWLERRHPQDWARTEKTQLTGADGSSVEIKVNLVEPIHQGSNGNGSNGNGHT